MKATCTTCGYVARSEDALDHDCQKVLAEKARSIKVSRKEREKVLRDLGLTKVKGAVSGRTYWE